jgi:hypothetical protein
MKRIVRTRMNRNIARTTLTLLSLAVLLAGLAPAVHAQDGNTDCSLSTLEGHYSFQAQGTVVGQLPGFPAPPLPFAEVAIDYLDGAGNISGRFTANIDGVVLPGTVAGTYSVNSDCTGTIRMHTNSGIPVNESFVIFDNTRLQLVQTDPYIVITRTMEKMGN